jgi:hypothetical protein
MSDKNFTSGDLGCATGGEWSHKSKASGANVSYVEFENGEIIRYANGSHQGEVWSICSGDWNCRLNWGGVDADMGFPVGEEYAWGTGTFQKFEKGGISFQYSIGSWWISGTIFDYWLNHGGMDGMGAAMGNEYDVWVDGVWHRAQDFTKGTLCRNMNTGQVTEGCPPALTNDFAGFPVSGYMSQISQDWNVYNYGWVGTHMGQDIGLSAGTPVYAMADGQVRHSQYHAPIGNHPDYGYCVIIEHTIPGYGSICSLYGHLASGIIGNGAVVKKGQQIGVIGTYEENGHNPEHLHFGLYPGPYSGTWIYWGYDPPGHVGETIRPSDFVNKY